MGNPELQPLVDLIETSTGLKVDENRRKDIARVSSAVMELAGVKTFSAMVKKLAALPLHHILWADLINTVTVGETYFYRNKAHMQALHDHLLPDLIAKKRAAGQLQLRIWSAGCASGEEPYSLAMMLHDLLPDWTAWQVSLLGTDIDLKSLERARRAVYRPSSFRNETPESIKSRWFSVTEEGFALDPVIRDKVTFAPLNLFDSVYPSAENHTADLDMIICRNVTIYFSEATTRAVVKRFNTCLFEGGWLVVGHSEPLASTYQDQGFVPRNFENAVFYQKCTEEAAKLFSFDKWDGFLPAPAPEPPQPVKPRPARVEKEAPSRPRTTEEALEALRKRLPKHGGSPEKPAAKQPSPQLRPQKPSRKPVTSDLPDLLLPIDNEAVRILVLNAKRAADRGDWEAAVDFADQAIALDVMNPFAHYLRGLVLMQVEDHHGALQSLRQAVYCSPTFIMAHYTLGELYKKRGNTRDAGRHWRMALRMTDDIAMDGMLWLADDLTADILSSLIRHHLDQLPHGV